jgi:rubrerythrin
VNTETIKRQVRIIQEAARLEEEASARHRNQAMALGDSRINALLEGIARTADEHLGELKAHMERLGGIMDR